MDAGTGMIPTPIPKDFFSLIKNGILKSQAWGNSDESDNLP